MTTGMYTAVIVEPRKHPAMEFVLNNFFSNLDTRWNFMIFHGLDNEEWIKQIILKFPNHIQRVSLLNINVRNLTINEYSNFMTSKSIIELIPTEIFLIFQTDTMICPSEKDLIYDFIKYDYVGAPWRNGLGTIGGNVGNGGLSLRRKTKMLEILNKVPYKVKLTKPNLAEDLYYCGIYHKIPMYKPTWEQAKLFSMETEYSSRTFGLHKTWHKNNLKDIDLENRFPGYNELVRLNS
jgi:hypothetical protein